MKRYLQEVLKPFDIIEVIPHYPFSRFLKPKEWPLMVLQLGIQRYEMKIFPNCKPCGGFGSHILTALTPMETFEWTYPIAKYDGVSALEGKHVRVWRYRDCDMGSDAKAVETLLNFTEKVKSSPQLRDYDEVEYVGFLLQLALGNDVFGLLDKDKPKVCSTGAVAMNIYVHKCLPRIPRYFKLSEPDGQLHHLKAEAITPAHFGCYIPHEFKLVYEEREVR